MSQKVWAKIVDCERLNNSYMENPRFKIWFETNDKSLVGTTATNATVGYKFCSSMVGSAKTIEYHYTKSGNLIITDME